MKQLFSYREDGEKRVYEGDAFVTRHIDEADANRLTEIQKELDHSLDRLFDTQDTKLTPLNYALFACGIAIIGIMIYLSSTFGSLDNGFEKSPVLVALLGILCLVAIVITVVDKKKRLNDGERRVTNHDDNNWDELTKEEDALLAQSLDTLGIETDEEGLDVITLPQDSDPANLDAVDTVYMTVFIEDDHIVLSDYRARYEIKTSDFKKVEHINTSLLLCDPVKPVLNALRREYGVKEVKGKYLVPSYDIFTISAEHGDYTLVLPNYDGKLLAHLLGLDY